MSIQVKDFKWEKGKNDLEYIELLEKNLDSALSKYRECAKAAREQYKKGYIKGRVEAIDELVDYLIYSARFSKEQEEFIKSFQRQLKEQKNGKND